MGVPTDNSQPPNSHRLYVANENFGLVSVLCIFEHLNDAPDSHRFRLDRGGGVKGLRYVHTITVTNSTVTTSNTNDAGA